MEIEFAYFQSLVEHNFSTTTPVPANLHSAIDTVNAYQKSTCGFTFDK